MYVFKVGRFAGKTMEQAMLLDAPALYGRAEWAERKSILPEMVRRFNYLRKKLKRARIVARCYETDCKKRARWMTLPRYHAGGWLPDPYYWCSKHGPHETDGISTKVQIHFDVIKWFRDKGSQQEICKCVRQALGIRKGTRITRRFAKQFFVNL